MAASTGAAHAQAFDAQALGLKPGVTEDQSGVLQDVLLRAAIDGRPLFLPAGTYFAGNLEIPSNILVQGVPGASIIAASSDAPVARVSGSAHVGFEGIDFRQGSGSPTGADRALLEIEASDQVRLRNCSFQGGLANGLAIRDAAVTIEGCDFSEHALAAIFSLDSRGLLVTGNSIDGCGNGGIMIWGSANRHDGSIVTGNRIARIGWTNGGNGQNGNGINIFRCDDVVIADNQISECAFTAIRLNSTNNVLVTGNLCRESGEVAIFSEFAFTGSVISDNIVDGAAAGISITNMDKGGQIAVCSGNIVRNIRAESAVNPETRPVGIYAEAETVVSGNTIYGVTGMGIQAGYGTYLRNVVIADNVLYAIHTGIGVSVVQDPEPGPVRITGNIVTDPLDYAIVGLEWDKVVSTDLVKDAAKYPHVSIEDNSVTVFGGR